MKKLLWCCFFLLWATSVSANQVAIRGVQLNHVNGEWTIHVTLSHKDTGWENYADAWQVVNSHGDVIAKRTLYHPHVHEQPFTRSLTGVKIPQDIETVYIEAHDNVHGWSKDRVKVDLDTASGDRYQIHR